MITNKNILIVGGSKGIGLSLFSLLKQNNNVIIANRNNPENVDNFIYFDANLTNVSDLPENVDIVIVCCGKGLLDFFEQHSYWDIVSQFNINTITPALILKKYYNNIINNPLFKICIISSINSFIESPLFSIYGASKTAITKVISNINSELDIQNVSNKILNIVLTHVDGTSFYGDTTDIKKLSDLAINITTKIESNESLCFLPDEKLCKSIIYDFISDKKSFNKSYYKYKNQQKLISKQKTLGYLSGSFDYLHIGHINIIKQAKKHCDFLMVGVHKDGSHKNKKLDLSLNDRIETLKSVKFVDDVIVASSEDIEVYNKYKYDFLFVGDDYKNTERFNRYEKYFENTNTKIIYFPYTTHISSSNIRNNNNE